MATYVETLQDRLKGRGIDLWQLASQHLLLLLAIGFTIWLLIVPLGLLLLVSFRMGTPWNPGAFTLDNYITAYSNSQTYSMLANTLGIAVASTFLSLAAAVLFAYLTERTDMPFKNVAWGLILMPMAVPGLLFGISWTLLLSPRIGLFNVVLRDLLAPLGLQMAEGPLNIYSLAGLIFLEGLRGTTSMFLILVGAFRAMDPSLEEAATMSGASRRKVFSRVFIPLLMPAIFSAGMYSFMTHLESLEVPLVVGLPSGIHVFSTYIYFMAQRSTPPQYGLSAALGATFLLASLLLVYAYRRIAGRAERFATVTGKGYRSRPVELGRWRYPALGLFLGFFLLTIGAPIFTLVWRSLHRFYVPPSFEALSTISLQNYADVFRHSDVPRATLNTLMVGVAAALLTMLLSLIVSWAVVRLRFRGRLLLDGLTFLPHAIPGVVIGVALIYTYLQPPLSYVPIYNTVWIIVLGLTVSYIAFGSRTMNAAVTQLHGELEEQANISGASWVQTLRRIVVPLLLPSLISGLIWVGAHSLRSFSIPLLLSGRDTMVISVVMWDLWNQGKAGPTAALGVMLILVLGTMTVGGRWMVTRMSRR